VVQDLNNISDASLNDLGKAMKNQALFDARAQAAGAWSGDSYGGSDMESACEIKALNYDILGGYEVDKGRPKIFASDDDVLRETNGIYLHSTQLKWLDVGTFASALDYCFNSLSDPDRVRADVGDPATNDVAKGMILLRNWWIERVSASANAQTKCTVFSTQDRAQIWEAFSADQHFNNDGSSSMNTYQSQLSSYSDQKRIQYRNVAKFALRRVFPDNSVLTAEQRQLVVNTIDAETAFGLFPSKIAAALDVAQGASNGAAAKLWNDAFKANVARIGGNYAPNDLVRPEDESTIRSMFEEVKSWVASQYKGYPIDISSLYSSISFSVDTTNNANTSVPGKITFGIGTSRSKMEYYSILIHELRHAVYFAWKATAPDKSKVKDDEGPVLEGSGVAVEALLLEPFLKQTLQNDTAYALYALDYGIRDARYAGTTDATLQRYFRTGCAGPNDTNTIEFTKSIARSYGLTGVLADNAAIRAHARTQYFQYISGGLQVLDAIAYLQSQIDPSGQRRVDPYVLFACGLNTPRRDATYVSALQACMKR